MNKLEQAARQIIVDWDSGIHLYEAITALREALNHSGEADEMVAEWEKLKDPQTLFVNLNRGFPAQLTRDHLLHLLNKTEQPVSQEPVGTAGELFTMSVLERLDVRPSTKVYLDSTPSAAEIVLKSCIYFDSIDFSQKPPFLRYDTGDSTPQDNWTVYCDIQGELREFGYELTDSDVDHDTVCGDVTPIAADRSKNK